MDEQNPPNPATPINPEGTPPEPTPQPTPAPTPTPQPEPVQQPQQEQKPPEQPAVSQSQPAKPKHSTLMAVLAYVLFFIPLLTDAKNDPFVKFHVKQGLVLFIACLATGIIVRMPVIGWILIAPLNIFLLILWIIGVLNALGGKQKPLPVIGQYGEKFDF
ncbi:MAG: hypothetical protein G01um101413_263 [Parcubacteria group bacterium Gr01-1014_13]|nr:MAG: hypothetical protein G01um101413_263 [Parcubacteria group bacterium Gr01-1014_13]